MPVVIFPYSMPYSNFLRRDVALLPVAAILLAAIPFFAVFGHDTQESKKELKAQAEALLAKSQGLSNIEAPGSPPFVLNMKIHYRIGAQSMDGQGQIIWLAPDHYREAFNSPGYEYTEIVRDGYQYLSRTKDEMPLQMYELRNAIVAAMHGGVNPADLKIKQVKAEPSDSHIICVDYDAFAPITDCLDGDGDVVSSEMQTKDVQGILARHYEFSDFAAFEAKRFPRKIAFRGGDGDGIEIEVSQLAAVKTVAPVAFNVPAGAMKEAWCESPTSEPLHPASRVDNRNEFMTLLDAEASVYLVVDANGHVRAGTVIHQTRAIRYDDLKTMFRAMRFPRTLCGNNGIEYETIMHFGH
ncbi:MAG TPA: hypothetical protein VGR81_00480 [Candidatus Acidoferrales bacterium]|nr:hypothetical protein [Candidatus Acidoferrales bacterium]